jgi:hypothetical protein
MTAKKSRTVERTSTRTGLEGSDIAPDRAGAHGDPQGETRIDTSSGLSGSKGVDEVGDPAVPTSKGGGLEVGTPSKYGQSEEDRSHTLEAQLRDKGLTQEEREAQIRRHEDSADEGGEDAEA